MFSRMCTLLCIKQLKHTIKMPKTPPLQSCIWLVWYLMFSEIIWCFVRGTYFLYFTISVACLMRHTRAKSDVKPVLTWHNSTDPWSVPHINHDFSSVMMLLHLASRSSAAPVLITNISSPQKLKQVRIGMTDSKLWLKWLIDIVDKYFSC